MEDLSALLDRDPAWRPSAGEAEAWLRCAAEAGAPPVLAQEVRWWQAFEAARLGHWDAVSALADEGLAEPSSEREAVRLALLHCMSGSFGEAEHVIAQAVQLGSEESLPRRFSALCAREGLAEAAARFA